MDVNATEEKPKPLPPYGGPPPPAHRMPPPEGAQGVPSSHAVYEPSWRPYPPTFDATADQRRPTNAPPQPPIPPHGYPVHPNRELPQIPHEAPYGRPNSLPGPSHSPQDAHPPPHPAYRPMNGAPPHEAIPHTAPGEYRPRMAYPPHESHTNGEPPPHSIPPGQYPPGVPHMSQPPGPYEPGYYHNQAFGARQRKAARAQQACDQCRARKAKCDEGRPACSHCKENNLVCVYKEVPPHKQEKATQLVLDKLQQIEDRMTQLQAQVQAQQVEHSAQLSQQSAQISEILSRGSPSAVVDIPPTGIPASKAAILQNTPVQPSLSSTGVSPIPGEHMPKSENVPVPGGPKVEGSEKVNDPMIKDDDDGELSIPVEHTTAAHKLLLWPSIRRLLGPKEFDEDYVMRLEEERGLIRVYGRGEGDDRSDYDRSAGSPTTNSSSPCWEDDYTQGASPNLPWGTGLPIMTNTAQPKTRDQLVGGLDEFGQLNTDPETVRKHHRSYLNHLHILHPFLDENSLERKIERFIKLYSPQRKNNLGQVMPGNPGDPPRGAKRKRSSEGLHGVGYDMQSSSPSSNPERPVLRRIEKSIDNAIILLVLALGCICDWTDKPIPGPVKDASDIQRDQMMATSAPWANVMSPAVPDSPFHSSGGAGGGGGSGAYFKSFPSPTGSDHRRSVPGRPLSSTGWSAHDGPEFSHPKNMEVIPGLAYYAYATDILGNLQGGNGLAHVQAGLLAGLYAGQLAHPFQSHGWISQASRACQVLVRPRRYEKMQDGPKKDLYDFAYWTCLQLESDILAELDLPASGISRSEARISLPKGVFTLTLPNEIRAPSTMMMFYYSAQIHLRKVLNRVHTDLYKAEKKGQSQWSSSVQEVLSMNLELWRKSLPEIMRWKDSDPPSSDINTARMRAKYYGARYIIHRPLLYHALHYADFKEGSAVDSPTGSAVMSGSRSQQVSPSMTHSQRATSMARWSSDMGPPGRHPLTNPAWPCCPFKQLPKKLQLACKICIDSAIQSTEAFDGIQGRPVITNIFGTAHAQFGNMLVLSATYISSLSELVDRHVLQRLLKRTIDFLLQSRNISPSLRADAEILTEIYNKLFGEQAATSFTSSSV
ncbi:transcriptional regulator family: Fungal Specific TF [Paecilomyces variotii]|nr:transcriptional regulator family: Fungal Specific TF [Paecilomyces variotii]